MKCDIKKCKEHINYMYYGFGVCQTHWKRHCDSNDSFDLKKELKIEDVNNG